VEEITLLLEEALTLDNGNSAVVEGEDGSPELVL
jgi:hypothetical protein